MITTLDEAIKHCKEVAKELKHEAEISKKKEEVRFTIRSKYSESLHNSSGADFDVGNIDLTEYNDCLECANDHEQLEEWLTELAERRETDRWNVIHSEEDLPKDDGFYLVTIEYRESSSGKLKRNTSELYFSTGFQRWTDCGEEFVEDGVIAWRSLPKPYESEDK